MEQDRSPRRQKIAAAMLLPLCLAGAAFSLRSGKWNQAADFGIVLACTYVHIFFDLRRRRRKQAG